MLVIFAGDLSIGSMLFPLVSLNPNDPAWASFPPAPECSSPVTSNNEVFALSCLPRNLSPTAAWHSLNTMLEAWGLSWIRIVNNNLLGPATLQSTGSLISWVHHRKSSWCHSHWNHYAICKKRSESLTITSLNFSIIDNREETIHKPQIFGIKTVISNPSTYSQTQHHHSLSLK